MPHVLVKLWPGKSERQKYELAKKITKAVMETLHYGEDSVSVGIEEVPARNWTKQVYDSDIRSKPDAIYKQPGYDP